MEDRECEEYGLDGNTKDDENIGDVTGAITTVHLALNEMMYEDGPPEAGAAEIVSREAINLGCWTVESAENEHHVHDESHPPESGEPMVSNRPVIITQDLYCIADSRGSKYLPWPLRSTDYDMDDPLSFRIKKKRNILPARKRKS